MKKLIILFLLIMGEYAYSQNSIKLISSIEMGFENFNVYRGMAYDYYRSPDMAFFDIEVGGRFKGFTLKGSSKSFFW